MDTSIIETNDNCNEDFNIQINKISNQKESKDNDFCNFSD